MAAASSRAQRGAPHPLPRCSPTAPLRGLRAAPTTPFPGLPEEPPLPLPLFPGSGRHRRPLFAGSQRSPPPFPPFRGLRAAPTTPFRGLRHRGDASHSCGHLPRRRIRRGKASLGVCRAGAGAGAGGCPATPSVPPPTCKQRRKGTNKLGSQVC